ncbi:MAG: hypothetical protein K6E94_06335 [Elusimicrobiaceae bacterium]|nr:hypothetical protein [Elusimicrobiaceae bacterium]
MEEKKQRAGRNRTITISDKERTLLKKKILSLSDIKTAKNLENSTINADIFDAIKKIPDNFADLIIIDPPYNLTKNFNGTVFKEMTESSYDLYIDSWFHEVCKKLKPNGSLYMCGDWKCTSALQRAIEKELTVINRITWQREKGRGATSNWKNSMEDIWFAVKNPKNYYFNVDSVKLKRKVIAPYKTNGKPKDWQETKDGNFRITYPSNFWDDISVPFWSMPENTDHPTQKPEKLFAKLILASSKEGDIVFDPFLGSGTTSVVAKKLNRKYCGIEVNEEYCLLAAKRLQKADKDTSIQGYCNGVFWERNSLNNQKKDKTLKPEQYLFN